MARINVKKKYFLSSEISSEPHLFLANVPVKAYPSETALWFTCSPLLSTFTYFSKYSPEYYLVFGIHPLSLTYHTFVTTYLFSLFATSTSALPHSATSYSTFLLSTFVTSSSLILPYMSLVLLPPFSVSHSTLHHAPHILVPFLSTS
uniref:Uncharacterized protein n=1 Tax=Cacopsylla melanoneura TaxID=428564 RepID=A0A8D8ZCT3_9HEMI